MPGIFTVFITYMLAATVLFILAYALIRFFGKHPSRQLCLTIAKVLYLFFTFVTIAAIPTEWARWKLTDDYPVNYAQTIQLVKPATLDANTLIDGATVESLCHKPAPQSDVKKTEGGVFVRCSSPLLFTPGVFRVVWKS